MRGTDHLEITFLSGRRKDKRRPEFLSRRYAYANNDKNQSEEAERKWTSDGFTLFAAQPDWTADLQFSAPGHFRADQFDRLHVPANIDLWGYDVVHDWPWWRIQFPYFVEKILNHA